MADDYSGDTQTEGAVAVGGSTTGEIEARYDRDWFAVTLEAGKTYRFDLEGSRTFAGTLSAPYLRGIYNAQGQLLDGTTNHYGGVGNNSRVTFTATENATYYVSAGKVGINNGTYTLSVRDVTDGIPDDFTAGTDRTGAVTVGGSATGEIESNGDRDWFAVTLDAGKTYRFDLEGSATSRGTVRWPYLRGIYDANGDRIEEAGTAVTVYNTSQVVFAATAAATYYVSAGASGDGEGAYTLTVTDVTDSVSDDFTAGTGTAGAVTVGGSATGVIDFRGDRDWFAVTLDSTKTYRFDLEGSGTGALSDPYLGGIYDAEGTLFDGTTNNDGGSGRNSLVAFAPTEDGVYYVSASAFWSGVGAYRLSVREFTEDLRAGTDTTGAVMVGGSATGVIDFVGDRDWFAVTLDAGRTYRFDLENAVTGARVRLDPYLRGIYDANGNLIDGTTNNDGGSDNNSRVTFTAPDDATYYVSAGAHGYRVGAYTLSVTDVIDVTAGTGTAGAVTVGGSARSEIDFVGDRDWFAVTLEEGKTYQSDLEGSSPGDGALYDPYLYGIYDANGNLLEGTTNDDGGPGRDSRVTFAATENGTYYVSAGAYGSREGAYTLTVTDVTDSVSDDFTAGTGTAGAVTVGGSAAMGGIDFAGDRDWFAVTLEEGKTYRFDLEGSGPGALGDPYLRGIYDAQGNRIYDTTNDDGGSGLDSRVTFAATENGTYYVSAGAYEDNLGTYALSVEEVM